MVDHEQKLYYQPSLDLAATQMRLTAFVQQDQPPTDRDFFEVVADMVGSYRGENWADTDETHLPHEDPTRELVIGVDVPESGELQTSWFSQERAEPYDNLTHEFRLADDGTLTVIYWHNTATESTPETQIDLLETDRRQLARFLYHGFQNRPPLDD